MAADIPTQEPDSLRAGDTWRWTRDLSDYPAGTWTLKYRFKNASGGFEITATASGTTHSVSVSAATTATYLSGTYAWMAWVEGGTSEKYTLDEGACEVLADFRAGVATAALDDRSFAQKALDALEAWILTRDAGVASFEIAGRQLQYTDPLKLEQLRTRYRNEVAAEQSRIKLARGEAVPRRLQFRI